MLSLLTLNCTLQLWWTGFYLKAVKWQLSNPSTMSICISFAHPHCREASGDLVDLLQLPKSKAWFSSLWQSRLNVIWVKEIILCFPKMPVSACKPEMQISSAFQPQGLSPRVTVGCPCATGYMGQRVMGDALQPGGKFMHINNLWLIIGTCSCHPGVFSRETAGVVVTEKTNAQ